MKIDIFQASEIFRGEGGGGGGVECVSVQMLLTQTLFRVLFYIRLKVTLSPIQ